MKRLKLCKPDSSEIQTLTNNLSNVTPSKCAMCWCQEDSGTTEETVASNGAHQSWTRKRYDDRDKGGGGSMHGYSLGTV